MPAWLPTAAEAATTLVVGLLLEEVSLFAFLTRPERRAVADGLRSDAKNWSSDNAPVSTELASIGASAEKGSWYAVSRSHGAGASSEASA